MRISGRPAIARMGSALEKGGWNWLKT